MYQNQIHLHYPEAPHAMESRADRAVAIAIDVATLRRQGLEPVPEFFRIAERYVSGELSIEQFTAAIDGLRHHHAPAPREPDTVSLAAR